MREYDRCGRKWKIDLSELEPFGVKRGAVSPRRGFGG
jgi:hypothetical protein